MENIKRRVNALRNLQLKLSDAETKLFEELNQIECKHASVFEPLFAQREKIVNGEYEPTEEETTWNYQVENGDEEQEVNGNSAKKLKTENGTENGKGIPGFWLKALKSTSLLAGMIQEHDEPILRHLRDIRVKLHEQKPFGYTLEFHFNENEYFTNRVLSKTYDLTLDRDEKNPLMNDTTRLYRCLGSKIDWTEGKNVTVKVTKKKQTNKNTKETKEVSKEEKQGSFFDLFDTHTPDGVKPSFRVSEEKTNKEEDDDEFSEEEELEHLFDLDFELGQFIKDVLVPKALLYYTGELNEDNVEDEFDEDDDDDDDDDDDESEAENGKKH